MSPLHVVLLRLLAEGDALHRPNRDPYGPRAGTMARLRAQWSAEGAAAGELGGDPAAIAVGLDAAASFGLALRMPAGRFKLSDAGEAWARRLAGLPPMAACAAPMGILAAWADSAADAGTPADAWCGERFLASPAAPAAATLDEIAALEDALVPAIVRCWTDCRVSAAGAVSYAISDVGRVALEQGEPERLPPAPAHLTPSDAGALAYHRALRDALERLDALPSNPPSGGSRP